nr:hypothetical protein [uncultured Cellulosilyticum sp.]
MKKLIFGICVFLGGLLFSGFSFIYAIMNPGYYNGIGGLTGSLMVNDLFAPFIIALIITIVGLAICGYEAYFRK